MRFNNLFDKAKQKAIATLAAAIASTSQFIAQKEERIQTLLVQGSHAHEIGTEYRFLHTGMHTLDLMKEDFQHFAGLPYEDYILRQSIPSYEDIEKEREEIIKHITKLVKEYFGPDVDVNIMEFKESPIE